MLEATDSETVVVYFKDGREELATPTSFARGHIVDIIHIGPVRIWGEGEFEFV
jgi:hypothetical protein